MLASCFTHVRYVKRSLGGSACRVAAYNARTRITCFASGRTFNFIARPGLAHHGILLPPHTSTKFLSPETLWNAVEAAEKRKDSQVAKEILLRLPETIPSLEWMVRLTHAFITHHFVHERILAQVDIHSPPYQKDLNWHAHILMPLRRIHTNGLHFCPYKAHDLEPRLRGAKAQAITTSGLSDKWRCFLEQFCAENNFPVLTACAGQGRLHSEGPRYKNTPQPIKRHNQEVLTNRKRHHADPTLTLQHLLRTQDVFSLEDLTRLWGAHTPEESLRKEFLQDLIHHSSCACLGIGHTHIGVFSSQELAQRLPAMRDFILNHQHVTLHHTEDQPNDSHSVFPKNPTGRIVLPSAHKHPLSRINRALEQSPHTQWVLQGNADHGASSTLWGAPKNIRLSLVEDNPTHHILQQWQKAFMRNANACIIAGSHHQARTFTNSARGLLKTSGLLHPHDLYIATPQGPKPFACKERVLHNTGSALLPATIHSLSPSTITLTTDTHTYALDTQSVLPLTHAYVRYSPPPHTPSFALYTPPLTPPAASQNTLIICSKTFFDQPHLAKQAFHSTKNKAWSTIITPLPSHTFEHQLRHSLALSPNLLSLEATLQSCLDHTKHLPPGMHHLAALKTLFYHVWSGHDIESITQTITPHTNAFIAAWKSSQHPITPAQALRIEQQFFSGALNSLWHERHNQSAFLKLLSLRHTSSLTPQQEHWAHLATQKAFNTTPYSHDTWAYHKACHHQDWCFYHLMRSGQLPLHTPGQSAFYTSHLQSNSHALFNTPRQDKIAQHQL